MSDCIFCKIANKEIPSKLVFENEYVLAFEDINPVAPVHVLFIPKIHIENANTIDKENANYVSEIFLAVAEVAKSLGISDSGYRLINNCGKDGGQTVFHLHFHMIGGKTLSPGLICN